MDALAIREPWVDSLLAAAQKEGASLAVRRGTDKKVEGIVALVRENQELLARAQGISRKEVAELRSELESSRVVGRALEASLQSLVNEARLMARTSPEGAAPRLIDTGCMREIKSLCETIENYPLEFGKDLREAEEGITWLRDIQAKFTWLSEQDLGGTPPFDEERIAYFVKEGGLSSAQEFLVRNSPHSERLLMNYMNLRRAFPAYDSTGVLLSRIKALFPQREHFIQLCSKWRDEVQASLGPMALKVHQQVTVDWYKQRLDEERALGGDDAGSRAAKAFLNWVHVDSKKRAKHLFEADSSYKEVAAFLKCKAEWILGMACYYGMEIAPLTFSLDDGSLTPKEFLQIPPCKISEDRRFDL